MIYFYLDLVFLIKSLNSNYFLVSLFALISIICFDFLISIIKINLDDLLNFSEKNYQFLDNLLIFVFLYFFNSVHSNL